MGKGLGLSCAILALGAFIACFGALHLLNQIVQLSDGTLRNHETLSKGSARCKKVLEVDQTDAPHLSWLELIYMRWTVVFALLYSFAVMLLLRAKYLSNFEINLATSNTMMVVGFVLSAVLFSGTVMIHQREPFVDAWCNDFIYVYMYFIALTTGVAVAFFLSHSCHQHRSQVRRDEWGMRI
ncbi:uncharacterized protein LOC6504509 [Drosophila ananassae]|nr:uncharacterized protein LOC6504509 [Drosophila ananassae]